MSFAVTGDGIAFAVIPLLYDDMLYFLRGNNNSLSCFNASTGEPYYSRQKLDGLGHYMTYGLCENADVVQDQNLLPIGLAEGCRLKQDIPKDQVLTYNDVEIPKGRLCDKLRAEQNEYFA